MSKTQRNFVLGRMNKSLDERLLPNGEYIDALNLRLGSTEESEIGAVENTKGNTQLTELYFVDPDTNTNVNLSSNARTIGAYEDGANETLYWFVHDPTFTLGLTGKLDMIVSFNTLTANLIYHVVSIDDGSGINTTLNFDPQFLITGVNKIGDLLFFTDFKNPPRFINIKNNYNEPAEPTTTPSHLVPTTLDAWKFTAGSTNNLGLNTVGFHQGTIFGCPSAQGAIGAGVSPTTTQINLPGTGCYSTIIPGLEITPGFGIQGTNNASSFALTRFTTYAGVTEIGLILASGVGNPGNGTISGNITGDDGSSGTWTARYESLFFAYTDGNGNQQNPESTGPVSLKGVTLTSGVTYTLTN
jgi:hypothetical protein